MEGSIYQRKDGRWVGVVDVGKNKSGKRKQKHVYGKTKKDVSIQLNNLIYQIQNNLYRDPQNILFYDYIKEWYIANEAKWEETTAESYSPYIEKHIHNSTLRNIKLKDLLPIHLDLFYKSLLKPENDNKPLSVNTVKKIHYVIHSSLEYAKINNLILINPSDSIKLPDKKKYEPKIYTEEQFMTLLNLVKGTHDEIPILLAGSLGLRRGEIFGLRWKDIDFEHKRITIYETIVKNRKYVTKKPKTDTSRRTIAAPDYLFSVLKDYKKKVKIISADNSDRVITEYKAQYYSERFHNLLIKLNLPIIRLHDLRHYNAVIMMMYNIPDKVAASRLGHSNVQTLRQTYQHVLTDMDQTAAMQINQMFDKKK